MDLNQLSELDFNNLGEWPWPVKIAGVLLLCAAVGGAWYYYDTQDQLQRLARTTDKEAGLRKDFEAKQQKAANLQAYKDQFAEMEVTFNAMKRQLPDKTEVASLLVDVSQTGLAAGLEFQLFQPSNERTRDFYAELPISIAVTGEYHDFGRFISGLAALPRIVTVHDVTISALGKKLDPKTGSRPLRLAATVKTYRSLEEGGAKKQAPRRGRRR